MNLPVEHIWCAFMFYLCHVMVTYDLFSLLLKHPVRYVFGLNKRGLAERDRLWSITGTYSSAMHRVLMTYDVYHADIICVDTIISVLCKWGRTF